MKRQLVRMALGCALAFAFTVSMAHVTLGDTRTNCEKKLNADRARIDRDVAKHGEHSRQVDRDISNMDADRNWCREHKADWDHDRFDVGFYVKH